MRKDVVPGQMDDGGDTASPGGEGLPPHLVLGHHPSWVLREEGDGDALLFDADTGAVWAANHTAVALWELLDGSRAVGEVLTHLGRTYQGFDEAAAAGVVDLLQDLLRIGALVPRP
jgi:hypothetical protein